MGGLAVRRSFVRRYRHASDINRPNNRFFRYTLTLAKAPQAAIPSSTYSLRILSKEDTAETAVAIPPRTTPPATSEFRRFFSDGVTAASATSGLAIMAPTPTVTPATTFSKSFLLRAATGRAAATRVVLGVETARRGGRGTGAGRETGLSERETGVREV